MRRFKGDSWILNLLANVIFELGRPSLRLPTIRKLMHRSEVTYQWSQLLEQ
jgi:hypothetical protein